MAQITSESAGVRAFRVAGFPIGGRRALDYASTWLRRGRSGAYRLQGGGARWGRSWREQCRPAMAWLILAIVVAFAVDRFAPIDRRASGSAFSSFTSEVPLVPNRAPAAQA